MRTMHALAVATIALGLIAGVAAADEAKTEGTQDASQVAAGAPVAVGAEITVKKAVKLADLAKKPQKYVGKTVRLEGTVKSVCQGMGCWVEVEDGKGASFMAKSLDHTILLPKDCAGRKIVVQGVVTKQAPSGHEHAREGAEHAELEAGGHVCPDPSFIVATAGAKLK